MFLNARFDGLSRRSWLGGLGLALAGCVQRDIVHSEPITVFAAASMTDALEALIPAWRARGGGEVRLSFAASGALARQIEAGAPADVVILADPTWMDRLQQAARIAGQDRIDLVGNALVVIARTDAVIEGEPFAWVKRGGRRLAIGDPESVPAGAHAQAWLTEIGDWTALQPRIVTAADVRGVRAFVSRGEADLGIVYRSDVTGVKDFRVVAEPLPADRPAIVYPAALTVSARPGSRQLLTFLQSAEAGIVFRRYGFEPLG